MANEEQLAMLKQGVTVWNEWRHKNPKVLVDLRNADLRGADLGGANLNGAKLREATLSGANLSGANLRRAILSGAVLNGACLSEADLGGAILRNAYLGGADLDKTNLRRADFRRVHLSDAILTQADLSEANMSGASLYGAVLHNVILNRADLGETHWGFTSLDDCDLSNAKGLESARHQTSSTIGIDTIYRSKGNIPEVFLRGCGVPENFITFMHSLTGKAFDFYSCFVSHSAKDKPFVERLHNDLQAKGVRTWYFPEDAKWGETVWGEIDRGIKIYDKLVVVCSQNSLQSEPVIREIDRALNREAKEHKNILFPITLDRYVFDAWEHELKADLLRKVIGDFTGSSRSVPKYTKAFDKLLKDLQKESTSL